MASTCARSIRAAPGGADIPIVMVTGHNDTESIERAFMVGATDFIHKPVLWQTLPQRIEFILRAQDNLRSLKISEQKNRALLQALPGHPLHRRWQRHTAGAHHRRRHCRRCEPGRQDPGGGHSRGCRPRRAPLDDRPHRRQERDDLRLRGRTGTRPTLLRNPPAAPVRRHAGGHHARHHRAAQDRVTDQVPGLLRHPHRVAEPPAAGARDESRHSGRPRSPTP